MVENKTCNLKNDCKKEQVKNNSSFFIKKFEENNYSQSIIEAIINSIHAKATDIYINNKIYF